MQKFSAHVTTNKFVITNRQTTSGTSLPNDLGIFFKCSREQLIQWYYFKYINLDISAIVPEVG